MRDRGAEKLAVCERICDSSWSRTSSQPSKRRVERMRDGWRPSCNADFSAAGTPSCSYRGPRPHLQIGGGLSSPPSDRAMRICTRPCASASRRIVTFSPLLSRSPNCPPSMFPLVRLFACLLARSLGVAVPLRRPPSRIEEISMLWISQVGSPEIQHKTYLPRSHSPKGKHVSS
jgi:hypothetical protein